jgi:hypothetical protein
MGFDDVPDLQPLQPRGPDVDIDIALGLITAATPSEPTR